MKKFIKSGIAVLMLIAVLFASTVPNAAVNGSSIGMAAEAASSLYPITARTLQRFGRLTTYTGYNTVTVWAYNMSSYRDYEFPMRYEGEPIARTQSYTVTGYQLKNSDGYIDCGSDTIYILKIMNNTIAQVKYPVPGGYKTRYVYLKDLFTKGLWTRPTHKCKVKTTVYKYSTGNATFGSVFVDDDVIRIGTRDGRVQVLYPIPGGYKSGYCSQDQWNARFVRK